MIENNDVGSIVGSFVGSLVGLNDNIIDGIIVFLHDGLEVDNLDGFLIAVNVESTIEYDDDIQDGSDEGNAVGVLVGLMEESTVGKTVGV